MPFLKVRFRTLLAILATLAVALSALTVVLSANARADADTAPITLGTSTTLDATSSVTEAHYTYSSVPGRRVVLTVTASSLAHADGTPGSATAEAGVTGYTRALGTIADTPVVLGADEVMLTSNASELIIRTDGLSTGSITFTLSLAEDPTVPLTLGTTASGSIANADQALSFTFPATSGTRYKLTSSDVALHSPTDPALTTDVYSVRPGGSPSRSAVLRQTDTSLNVEYTAEATGTATVLLDPQGDVTGSLTVTVSAVDVTPVTTALVKGSPVTATGDAGRLLVFTYPGAPGGALPTFRLTDVALTATSGSARATVAMAQNGKALPSIGGLTGSSTTATFTVDRVLPYGFDAAKPWEFRVQLASTTSGSVTVTLDLPTVTEIAATSGTRYPVSFAGPKDQAKLTFTPTAGQRAVVKVEEDTASVTLDLRGATSNKKYAAEDRDEVWQSFATPNPPEPLVLIVTPGAGSGSGSAAVTVLLVTDPVIAVTPNHQRTVTWKSEQRPRLTFTAVTGQRLVLDVTNAAHAGSSSVVPSLYASDGHRIESLKPLTDSKPALLELPVEVLIPADGSYTLVLDPSTAKPGTITVRVGLFTDVAATATSGRPLDVRLTSPGQKALVTITVPDGTRLDYVVNGSTVPAATLQILAGSYLDARPVDIGKGHSTGTLPASQPLSAGTYTVRVDPVGRGTGRMGLTLTASPAA